MRFDLSLSTLASLTSPLFSNFIFSISRPVAVVAIYEPTFKTACPFGPKNAPPIAAPVFNAIAILPAVEAFDAAIWDGISYCQYSGENTLALAYLCFFLL